MAASPTASASGSVAAAAAAASEASDGPVLCVVSKRLRALRKKQNRIAQMEESVAAGKTLNQEQKEVLRSKPVVTALIDELERLRAPLSAALAEELATNPAPAAAAQVAGSSSSDSDSSIQDLLSLVYFGSLFDVKPQSEFVATMVARTHERSCCITYDYVTDDAADLLAENDLDAVSALAALAAARPAAAAGVSHRDALEACAHHARLWLRRADEPIHPDSSVTYAAVRAKLDRIMASDYYTAQPEMKSPVDMAAAVGSYGAGGVPVQESIAVSPEAPVVEENLAVEDHKDEKDEQATEIYTDHQSNVVDGQNVDDEPLVNPPEEYPLAEAEQEKFEDVEEQDQRNVEPNDQQFQNPRRSYQNQRGGGPGGRRGYSNGRGGRGGRGMGGGYQNGRGGGGGYQGGGGGYQGGGGGYQGGGGGYQNGRGGGGSGGGYYNDNGYYQQRNFNNRGRGGRSGGNSFYNNQGGGPQGGGRVELGANA